MSRRAKKQKVEKEEDAPIVFSLELLKQPDHQKIAKQHASTKLVDAPDDALAAECARRNLMILSSFEAGEDAVEKLIETIRSCVCSARATLVGRLEVRLDYPGTDLLSSLCALGSHPPGTVYEVSPIANPDKKYALKTMLKGAGNADGYENTDEDMSAEVAFLKRLHHPYIGGCIEVFESTAAFHLVLEEMKGGEVHDFLATHDVFTEDEATGIARQILEALVYLVSSRVVVSNYHAPS
jgi:serine/threonine protein kinase